MFATFSPPYSLKNIHFSLVPGSWFCMTLRCSKKEILTDVAQMFHNIFKAPNRAIKTAICQNTSQDKWYCNYETGAKKVVRSV